MSKKETDEAKEWVGIAVVALIILYIIYKFVTEILIPFLIKLVLFALALVLGVILARVLAHLFAYLTLGKRCGRKIAGLDKKISQLDAHTAAKRERGLADAWQLQELDTERGRIEAQRQNAATALADHLANKLDGLNRSRARIERKIKKRASEKLSRKLERKNQRAAPLEAEMERLKSDYRIEPDPAYRRKERMYPVVSKFDGFISSRLERYWSRRGAP